MASSALLAVPDEHPASSSSAAASLSSSSRRSSFGGKILIRRKSSRRTSVAVARRKSVKLAKDKNTLSRTPSRNTPSIRSVSLEPSSSLAVERTAAPSVFPPRSSSISPSVSPARRKLAYHHPALKRTDSFSSVWSDVSETEDPYALAVEAHQDGGAGFVVPLNFDGNDSEYQHDADYDAVEVYVHEDSDEEERTRERAEEFDFMERDNYYDSADDRRYQSSALLRLKRGESHVKSRRSIALLDGLLHDVEAFTSDVNYAPTLKSQRSRTTTVAREGPEPSLPVDPPAPAASPSIVVDTPSPPETPAPTPMPASTPEFSTTTTHNVASFASESPAAEPSQPSDKHEEIIEPTTPPASTTLEAPISDKNSSSDSAYSSLERRKNSGGSTADAATTRPHSVAVPVTSHAGPSTGAAPTLPPSPAAPAKTSPPPSPNSTSTTLVDEQAAPPTRVSEGLKTASKMPVSQTPAVSPPTAPARRTYRAPDAQPKVAAAKNNNSNLQPEPKKKGLKRFFRRLSKVLHV
ncbi:hypothetical protein HDU86_007179 [Geranomyces michiganensis]|nr:hypothetical protein HDU86_007179 [Geranomyces michiganensis]